MRQQRGYSQCINDCQAQYVPVLLGNYDDYIRMKIIAIVILSDCWAEWKYIKKKTVNMLLMNGGIV